MVFERFIQRMCIFCRGIFILNKYVEGNALNGCIAKKKIMNYKQNIDHLMFINMNLDLKICQRKQIPNTHFVAFTCVRVFETKSYT